MQRWIPVVDMAIRPDSEGPLVKYEDVEEYINTILFHLNKDKDGSYFLTEESYKELFDKE